MGCRIFRGFSRRIFSPHFCGKKVPRKILQENSRENPPKFIQQNPPTHFCRLAGARILNNTKRLAFLSSSCALLGRSALFMLDPIHPGLTSPSRGFGAPPSMFHWEAKLVSLVVRRNKRQPSPKSNKLSGFRFFMAKKPPSHLFCSTSVCSERSRGSVTDLH